MTGTSERAHAAASEASMWQYLKWAMLAHIPWCIFLILAGLLAGYLTAGPEGFRSVIDGLVQANVLLLYLVALAAVPNLLIAASAWYLPLAGLRLRLASALLGAIAWPVAWRLLLPPAAGVDPEAEVVATLCLAVGGGVFGYVAAVIRGGLTG